MSKIKDFYESQNAIKVRIDIPEWEKVVYVGPMTYGQFVTVERARNSEDGSSAGNLALVTACCKSEVGQPGFNAEEQADLKLYGSPSLIARVAMQVVAAQNEFATELEQKKT